ncbi:MAG: DCC1-like thiol-disulfide oxidoreductase family protein [Cyanobacteria bacterium P01_A01_bin.137]
MPATWLKPLERRYGLDLRSLALLRIGLALALLCDLAFRAGDLLGQGVVSRGGRGELWLPGYWSIHGLSESIGWQMGCFAIATLAALLMLIGYRTRWATIVAWVMLISLHNYSLPAVHAADDVLRAILFWAMFLPLGSSYSVDQALNTSPQPQPQRIFTGATLGLMAQQCYIYVVSALWQTMAPNNASVSPMIMGTALAWAGPLLLWSPFRTDVCRTVVVFAFVLFHLVFHLSLGLTPNLGLLSIVSCFTWLAFIPSSVWDRWAQRAFTPKQLGLKIYYDAECGFCKKVVHLLRTFLVLPRRVPLQIAQSDPIIQAAMETQNSWVIVDWQGQHHYKWQGIAYVVSLSPIVSPLARVLRWPPLMALGTRIYETIANNRRFAGNFTKPFKYQAFVVRPTGVFSVGTVGLLLLVTLMNVRSLTGAASAPPAIEPSGQGTNPIVQGLATLGQTARLDQSWHIFSPDLPEGDSGQVGN